MDALELVEFNPDPMKSEVMSRAAELRGEGYNKSDALSMAWEDILGEDYGEDEDEVYDFDEIMNVKTKTRRRNTMTQSNPDGGIGLLALVGAGAYLLWCAYHYSKTKVWSWTPWRTQPISRLRQLPRVVRPASDNSQESIITLIVP